MIYRYNVEVTLGCPTIDSTRPLSFEELEKAVNQHANIPEYLIRKIDILFEGDVTEWKNASSGPNFNPDK